MRQIKKTCNKAIAYKRWLGTLIGNHPKYTRKSIRKKYYLDIKANLMCCQKGLCAYTELRLDDDRYFKGMSVWVNGKYVGNPKIQGQLDHFDSKLKSNKAWCWENFFLCHSDINNSKGKADVLKIMKPDKKKYSPNLFLDYNSRLHVFTPSPKIKDVRKIEKITSMINTLGLNHGSIQRLRKKRLNKVFIDFKKKVKKLNQLNTDEFYTAFGMMKRKLA